MLAEKYRPRTLDEVVGQDHVVKALKAMLRRGDVPNMLFVGPPGCGKTATAHAFARELGVPIIELNASEDRGIQVVRERIKKLAFSAGRKIVLLDEADSMTSDAQHALRRIMERARETRFILTCNEEWRIIDPIKSRCAIFRFKKLSPEELLKIIVPILVKEGVADAGDESVRRAILFLVDYVDGDARKALNMIESLVMSGREVTEANIRLLVPGREAVDCLVMAYEGELDRAIRKMEDIFVMNKLDPVAVLNLLYGALKDLDIPTLEKARLYMELGEVERAIRVGGSPIIQFARFLACVWAVSRVPRGGR